MKKKALAMLAAVMLLAGCSSISEGTIVEKKHSDAYYYPVTYCMIYNSKGACSAFATRMDYMPESWWFDIEKGDQTGWVYVGELTFDKYNVGDYYGSDS
jgi:uncharacterized protein YceK